MKTDLTAVYEIVDATDDEVYWPLGMFTSLESAKQALDKCSCPDDLSRNLYESDEFCRIEIRERNIGWGGVGKCVLVQEWVSKYNEGRDEYEWQFTRSGGQSLKEVQERPG
jgi:hypothetical protein